MNVMDDWVKRGDQPGHDEGFSDHDVTEHDIVSSGEPLPPGEVDSEFESSDASPASGDTETTSSDDAAHAAKKARDAKILKAVGGTVLLLALGAAGLHFYTSGGPTPQQLAQMQAQQQAQHQSQQVSQPGQQQPNGAIGSAPVMQPGVLAPIPDASAPVAVDFGLQPGAPVPADGQPATVNGFPAPGAPTPVASGQPTGPSPALNPTPQASLNAPAVASPVQAPPAAAIAPVAPTPTPSVSPAELNELRSEIAALGQKVSDLSKEVSSLRNRPQGQAQPRPAPQPSPTVSKSEAGVSERREPKNKVLAAAAAASAAAADAKYSPVTAPVLTDSKSTPVALSPSAKNGKVRGDFTVYAISNGRAWVRWTGDGENYMVEAGSVLPDNSKVTNVDNVKGIVFSTGGEIHQKPSK